MKIHSSLAKPRNSGGGKKMELLHVSVAQIVQLDAVLY